MNFYSTLKPIGILVISFLSFSFGFGQTNTFPSDGNVGIGTLTPLWKLSVELNNNHINNGIRINQDGTGDAIIRYATNNTTRFSMGVDQSDGNKLKIGIGGTVSNFTRLTMLPDGSVGLGTSDPNENFHVDGGSIFIDGENQGLIIDRTFKRVGFMKYTGEEGYIARLDSQDFGIVRVGGGDIKNPTYLLKDFYMDGFGNIGIGNSNPDAILDLSGDLRLRDNKIYFRGPGDNFHGLGWYGNGDFTPTANIDGPVLFGFSGGALGTNPNNNAGIALYWNSAGNVGIGTTTPQNRLDVCGTIRAEEVKVEIGWCDYVFEEDYKLTSLEDVKSHIDEKGYLHNTPSATEVETEGLKLAEATVQQQEKIEEIFLHLIQLNEKVKTLEKENLDLKAQLEASNK